MTHVKKNKKVQIAYKENRMSPSLLDRRRVRAGAPSPHLTCNAYSQALLLGRHLVPLVDHHLPAMNINNVQLIHRHAPTRASSSCTSSASATVLGDIVDAFHLHRHAISSCCNTSSCSVSCISCCNAVLIMRVVAGPSYTDAILDVPCIGIDHRVCF